MNFIGFPAVFFFRDAVPFGQILQRKEITLFHLDNVERNASFYCRNQNDPVMRDFYIDGCVFLRFFYRRVNCVHLHVGVPGSH